MQPYIFGKRNGIHIIDIRETVKGLLRAKKFLSAIVSQGHDVLIVGTKRQARDIVEQQAPSVGMHYVNDRWLGGTLTNFSTIRSRLARLEELEAIEESGKINEYSKKMKSILDRERRKIKRNLDGIRRMTRLPGALVLLDVRREKIASNEARKLGIPTIGLVDTDSDPDVVDLVIPGNDDAMRAIELVVTELTDALKQGMQQRSKLKAEASEGASASRPRRSRRKTTSELAEEQVAEAQSSEAQAPATEPAVSSMPVESVATPSGAEESATKAS